MDKRIEPKADKRAWWILGIYLVVNCVIFSTSRQMEVLRLGEGESAAAIWMFEITSHFAVFVAAGIIPVLLSRFPLSIENWPRRIPVYAAGFAVFTVFHILLMVGLRHILYPLIETGSYNFGVLRWEPWVYEIRKDFMAYSMILSLFLVSRHLAQTQFEAEMAKQDARDTGRISLPSGGRTIFLEAKNIHHVKAAGNYVEVHTEAKTHLVRMTLSAIEKLLFEAGQHIRIHRSYIVRTKAIRAIAPDGSGETELILSDNLTFPVSRKYRNQVLSATQKS